MQIAAADLFAAAAIKAEGCLAWGEPIPCQKAGVYVIETDRLHDQAPVDAQQVRAWLERVPGLLLDDRRPAPEHLIERLRTFWWPTSRVIYVGCTEGSLASRLLAYRRHVLGDRSPHRGGQWIKTLSFDVALSLSRGRQSTIPLRPKPCSWPHSAPSCAGILPWRTTATTSFCPSRTWKRRGRSAKPTGCVGRLDRESRSCGCEPCWSGGRRPYSPGGRSPAISRSSRSSGGRSRSTTCQTSSRSMPK